MRLDQEGWKVGPVRGEPTEASPALLSFLRENPIRGRIIVPGCGCGHNVRAIAEGGAEILGIDATPRAIEEALRRPVVARERYLRADWLRLPVSFGQTFDWVVEEGSFCALPPSERSSYVDAVEFALRKGGQFLGIFPLHSREEAGRTRTSADELNALFSRFWMVAKWQPKRSFGTDEGREEVRLYRKRR